MTGATPNTPNVTTSTVQNLRGLYVVHSLSGHPLELQTPEEMTFYEDARNKYMSENLFTAASDKRTLDRLLFFETQMFRWHQQLALGMNYDDEFLSAADEQAMRRGMKETAPLISQIQTDLSLTKSARDKQQFDSVGSYIQQLQIAAKEHGVRREKQLGKAIELTKELFHVAGQYKRSSEFERAKIGYESAEDVVDWVLEVMKPQFDEVDAYFRQHQQRAWIRKI